jgi:hypothetical protein
MKYYIRHVLLVYNGKESNHNLVLVKRVIGFSLMKHHIMQVYMGEWR